MERNKLYFIDSIDNYGVTEGADHVIHILCTAGCMSFSFQETHYNIAVGDYVILTDLSLASDFSRSEDFTGIVLCLSESFVSSMALRSNYGIIGHMSLLQNPVMKLSEQDFRKCRTDMLRLRERMEDSGHLFHEEMIGHLLMAHILDLYDIHARQNIFRQVPKEYLFFCGGSSTCSIRANTSETGICLTMLRGSALRLTTCPKYAKRRAESRRHTG